MVIISYILPASVSALFIGILISALCTCKINLRYHSGLLPDTVEEAPFSLQETHFEHFWVLLRTCLCHYHSVVNPYYCVALYY